jgi:hypothetical protein
MVCAVLAVATKLGSACFNGLITPTYRQARRF